MTEHTKKEQKPHPHLQEESVENELESTKAIADEALKKVEKLSRENAELRKKLKSIDDLFKRYEHLDGYMEKYGFNNDLEKEMWQTIRKIIKG